MEELDPDNLGYIEVCREETRSRMQFPLIHQRSFFFNLGD